MKRVAIFGLVSMGGTAIHYLVLVVMVECRLSGPLSASVTGAACGLVVNYLLHHRISFISARASPSGFLRFAASGAGGFAVNAIVMTLLLDAGAAYLFAQVLATGAAFTCNYLLARHWVFRGH